MKHTERIGWASAATRSLWGMAVAAVLVWGLASCKTKNKEVDNGKIKTVEVAWEERPTVEGCKLNATYPVDETTVAKNIREWINETLGGHYTGDLTDGKKVLEYYGQERAAQIRQDKIDMGKNPAMSESVYYVQLKNVFETDKLISYTAEIYEYAEGAHGGESLEGSVFRKSDGRRFGWEMFTADGRDKLRGLIRERLKRNFFNTRSDDEFNAKLLIDDDPDLFPLPKTAPVCLNNGVQFIYQQYEIAPFSEGIPTCTLPYSMVAELLSPAIRELLPVDPLAAKESRENEK